MPTTHAHYRHGEEVRKKLGPEAREIIDKYPELFHFGVHGPDFLFYYDALKKNRVNQMGYAIHNRPGREFFEKAVQVLQELSKEGSGDYKASLAYIYGVLCHFSLDVRCHGYVNAMIDEIGVGHLEIEAELDREMLLREGFDPVRTKVTGHLAPSGRNARVVSRFYDGISQEDAFKCMKDMVWYLDFLATPSKVTRGVFLTLLKVLGQYELKKGLFINYEKNEACVESTEHLLELFDEAVDLAVDLIGEFPALKDEAYDYDFCSVKQAEKEIYQGRRA